MGYLRIWFRALADGFRDPDARPLYLAAIGLLILGTIFYTLVEGWTVLDALYFCVTTLATVGFGDITPQTALGRAFTIVYILAGVSVLLAFANAVLAQAGKRRHEQGERLGRLEQRIERHLPREREH
jgi:voltage-gated potassium channel